MQFKRVSITQVSAHKLHLNWKNLWFIIRSVELHRGTEEMRQQKPEES